MVYHQDGKKSTFFPIWAKSMFSVSHDCNSIGNQLLTYQNVVPEIDLPNRVQLVPELEHFVGSLPLKSGHFAYMHAFSLQCNCITVQIPLIIRWYFLWPELGEGFRQNALTLSLIGLCRANLFQIWSQYRLGSWFPINLESLVPPKCPAEKKTVGQCFFCTFATSPK